jgi:hypothetical protein
MRSSGSSDRDYRKCAPPAPQGRGRLCVEGGGGNSRRTRSARPNAPSSSRRPDRSLRHGADDFAAAQDDGPSADGAAPSLMSIAGLTLQADITMTAPLRRAVECNAAPGSVLAQITVLTDLGNPYAIGLAGPRLVHGRRSSHDPRKFQHCRDRAAFRDRHRYGDDA